MSSDEFRIESPEQKEMRKKILEIASQEIDNVQSELYDWKTSKFNVNPGSHTAKSRHSSIFDMKVEQIQNKIKARKGVTELSESSANFDQKASHHSSLLTQELYTRQLQLFKEKHEIEVNNLKTTISTLTSKLCRFEQETLSIRENFQQIITSLEDKTRLTELKLQEKDSEIELLKGKIQDNETIIKLLQEKLIISEKNIKESREKDYELSACKGFYEKEKKRREIAENEYKILIDEVKELNERACEQIRIDCQREVQKYKDQIKALQRKVRDNDSRASAERESGREGLTEVFRGSEESKELSKTIQFYEDKCAELNKQLKVWKVKTLNMAERMLSIYKANAN